MEICAGRASFSKAAREAGFETISIDHQVVSPLSPILVLDLTTTDGKQILFSILEQPRLLAVHMGLPCGTASRARDRPIPAKLQPSTGITNVGRGQQGSGAQCELAVSTRNSDPCFSGGSKRCH